MSVLDEYEAFKRLTDGAQQAIDGAMLMAKARPDQAKAWEKLAEAWGVAKEACYRLAGEKAQ